MPARRCDEDEADGTGGEGFDQQRSAASAATLTVDTEALTAAIVRLRHEHPHGPLTGVLRLLVWEELPRQGERYFDYQDRLYGPMEDI